MIFLERQQAILNELAQLIFDEAPGNFASAECEYRYIPEYSAISSKFSYTKNGEQFNPAMSAGLASKNMDLTEELRSLMKAHTGGEWESFTLSIDATGKAQTKFNYPNE